MFARRKDVHEHTLHNFTTFASDLGISPTGWPDVIFTDIGNGMPLYFVASDTREDDLLSMTYRQACGCVVLKIFND